MKSKVTLLILIIALVIGFTTFAEEEQISNTRNVSCVLKFNNINSRQADLVSMLLSSKKQQKVIDEVLNTKYEKVAISWTPSKTTHSTNTISFNITINLADDVKPVAKEFFYAVIENLKQVLHKENLIYQQQLADKINEIEDLRQTTLERIENIRKTKGELINNKIQNLFSPEEKAVKEQLQKIVDLSQLNQEMPFSEAIEKIQNSADPPLKVFVNWSDLYDNADIDRTTAIDMDPIPEIELKTALKLLLEAVSGGFAELGYSIEKGVIVIATVKSLPNDLKTVIYDVSGTGNSGDLSYLITEVIEPESWFDTGGEGIINIYGNTLVIKQNKEVHLKIKEFLESVPQNSLTDNLPVNIELLTTQETNLNNDKQRLNISIARLNAQQSTIESQIRKINDEINIKIKNDPIIIQLNNLIGSLSKRRKYTDQSSDSNFEVSERMIQTQLQLAQRKQVIIEEIGGNKLDEMNKMLREISMKLVSDKAEIKVIEKQLRHIRSQIKSARTIEPQKIKIKHLQQQLLKYEKELMDLKAILKNSQEPVITVLGID